MPDPTPGEIAKKATKDGVALFKRRDWDGSAFNLPGGLLSSIWECFERALKDSTNVAVADETECQREKIKRLSEQLIKCHMAEDEKLMAQGGAIENTFNEIGIDFDALYQTIDQATAPEPGAEEEKDA